MGDKHVSGDDRKMFSFPIFPEGRTALNSFCTGPSINRAMLEN